MTFIQERLFALQDKEYAAFQAKLTPTLPPEAFIGVRVPQRRQLAAEFEKDRRCADFLRTLPHTYYDEDMLHALLLTRCRPFEDCLAGVEAFLPYVNNWAVCDTLRPKVFARSRDALLPQVLRWSASDEVYTCRFGIGMLMAHYLDGDFRPEYLVVPGSIQSSEYYVNMMIAWYFATALAKQWDAAVLWLEGNRLPVWVHNKTIQKAVESFRITGEQKQYLRSLRRAV